MSIILLCLLGGMLSGWMLRYRHSLIHIADRLTTSFIYLFLCLLGVTVGANETVMENLAELGLQALILSSSGIIGSVVIACLVEKLFFKDF